MSFHFRASIFIKLALLAPTLLPAADWPMWRFDAARTASSPEQLPERLRLQWVREYPALRPAFWQVRQERLQFDLGYEPVVMGRTMFVASSRNDSVTALDVETGAEKWRFYADGPVRLAPAAWNQMVYFASDDGCLYCLRADSGALLWKVRAAPSSRKVLGNERLISVWPARGGPVAHEGRVYFTAGVWPFEGVFVHALDARTGRPLWVNDRTGSLYSEHPHAAMSFGGPSPQGCLMVNRGRLVAPSSRAFPAFFDLATGELQSFEFGHGGHGSRPGSWFVTSDKDGALIVDPQVNTETHDAGQQVIGQTGIRRVDGEALQESVTIGKESYRVKAGVAAAIQAGTREFRFQDGFPGVEGAVHTMLAAAGRLFVVTRAGAIYCFGPGQVKAKRYVVETQRAVSGEAARALLQLSGQGEGCALVWGTGDGKLAEALAAQPKLRVIAVDRDVKKIAAFRQRLDAAGLYGEKIAAHAGEPAAFGWPPYLANLIVVEEPAAVGGNFIEAAFAALRPYGGTLCVKTARLPREKVAKLAGAQLRQEGGWTLIARTGPLPGAVNYTGQPNFDERVRAPLGLLWFGDTYHHHKLFYKGVSPESGRGLPAYITVEDGVISYMVTGPYGEKPGALSYPDMLRKFNEQAHAVASSDVYTGRLLANGPKSTPATARAKPLPLVRRNPITGREEAREYMKTYGCDLFGADYGHLITLRSGTAAFYDKRIESGTINISGLRSGCRNNMVPACGVLNLPTWTGNCTCNYPVFTSLALVTMPESFEQWAAWGGLAETAPIRRVGINFGAPGDRMTEDGTLWLDWPSVGGPSPDVRVQVAPADARPFYRHALWMKEGEGWPWVFASGIQGVRSVRIETTARATNAPPAGAFSARWTGFVQTGASETNTFHVRSDGTVRLWVDGFPIVDSGRYKAANGLRELSGRFLMEAGRKHTLHLEYAHPPNSTNAGPACVELSWSSPSRPKEIIPSGSMSTPDGQAGGLAGVYFARVTPSGPGLVQMDSQISFDWGAELPPLLRKPRQPAETTPRAYTVRLVFAEPEEIRAGQRVFDVQLQGRTVLSAFDILKQADGSHRGVVREFRGVQAGETLEIGFVPSTEKPPLICGVELIAEK